MILNSNKNQSKLIISTHLKREIQSFLSSHRYSKILVIGDKNTLPLFIKLQVKGSIIYHLVPEKEKGKSLEVAKTCFEKMLQTHFDRNSLIIAIGGGSCLDLAGFVSSCYMRGIDLIFIPTTLLAMVDAAIGGKNAINFDSIKNVIGTFYPPKAIFIDHTFLQTLPKRQLNSAMAEVVKYAVALDPSLIEEIDKDLLNYPSIIQKCCHIKMSIVNQDEKDRLGIRYALNYGHTFGHAIESVDKSFLHGEAVSIGMHLAALLSFKLGFIDKNLVDMQDYLCKRFDLPILLPNICPSKLYQAMKKDKKAKNGNPVFICLKSLGQTVCISNASEEMVKKILSH